MLEEEPRWTCAARGPVTQWYGHVILLDEFVLGQWVCIRRDDGTPLWERRFRRANTVAGVQNGVIVASEMPSDGPWTVDFGCYGIGLTTGRLLWVSHRDGLWGRVVRALDYVPGFTNELRDAPVRVYPDEVICRSGRVLDIHTGRLLRRVTRDEAARREADATPDRRLLDPALRFSTSDAPAPPPVRVTEGCYVSRYPPSVLRRLIDPQEEEDKTTLYGLTADGAVTWCFRVAQPGYHSGTAPFRFACPYFYFVVSDAPVTVPVRAKNPRVRRYNPGRWHALTLDARTGAVVQDILLGPCEVRAKIEDIDDKAVLFSLDGRRLVYHARAPR